MVTYNNLLFRFAFVNVKLNFVRRHLADRVTTPGSVITMPSVRKCDERDFSAGVVMAVNSHCGSANVVSASASCMRQAAHCSSMDADVSAVQSAVSEGAKGSPQNYQNYVSDACRIQKPASNTASYIPSNIPRKSSQKNQEPFGNPNKLPGETTEDFRARRVREGRQAQLKRERSLQTNEIKKARRNTSPKPGENSETISPDEPSLLTKYEALQRENESLRLQLTNLTTQLLTLQQDLHKLTTQLSNPANSTSSPSSSIPIPSNSGRKKKSIPPTTTQKNVPVTVEMIQPLIEETILKIFSKNPKTPTSIPNKGNKSLTSTLNSTAAAVTVTRDAAPTPKKTWAEAVQGARAVAAERRINTIDKPTPNTHDSQSAPPKNNFVTVQSRRTKNKNKKPTPPSVKTVSPSQSLPLPRKQGKHSTKNMLVIPNKPGVNALAVLENNPVLMAKDYSIKRHVPFPSGAVLFNCADETSATSLTSVVNYLFTEIKVKGPPLPRPCEVRIHNIPSQLADVERRAAVCRRFEMDVDTITFVPYKSQQRANQKLAICTTSIELFNKFKSIKTIHLGWGAVCPVSTEPLVSRCGKCRLLGHREKHCPKPESSQPALNPSECLDCQNFNAGITQANLSRRRLRRTDHRTGDALCPTKAHILGKRRNHPLVGASVPRSAELVGMEISSPLVSGPLPRAVTPPPQDLSILMTSP